uniref:Uncharacterized protein n=1 Tax=Rhizophora mucronata TaxID=61149 RepID=A0A2P2JEM2_RHIMU
MEPQLSTGPRRDPMHISVWSLFQSSGHWLAEYQILEECFLGSLVLLQLDTYSKKVEHWQQACFLVVVKTFILFACLKFIIYISNSILLSSWDNVC